MLKRVLAVLLATALLVLTVPVCVADTVAEQTGEQSNDVGGVTEETETLNTYIEYYDLHSGKERPAEPIVLAQEQLSAVASAQKATGTFDDKTGTVLSEDNLWSEWTVEIPSAGIYNLSLDYYPIQESGRDITLSVTIDGKSPFVEAKTLSLSRLWEDKKGENGLAIQQDELGNDLRPTQVEVSTWITAAFIDQLGMYSNPYFFYFEAGTHTIRIERVREALAVNRLVLSNQQALPTYEEYAAGFDANKKPQGEVLTLQAETPYTKTSPTLYALTDHQDVATTPNDPVDMRMNTIGGSNWVTNGQTITWKVPVTEEGWYRLAFRARQSDNQGMVSYRSLAINGQIPFEQAGELEFYYDSEWKVYAVGGEEALPLYLKPGDEISLACVPGKLCDVLRTIQQSVLDMNQIYREIIVITGTAPDVYQDYYLEDEIPGLQQRLLEQKERLDDITKKIIEVTGDTGAQTATLQKAAEKLAIYASKSYEITANLGEFKSNIESLSSLLLTFGEQPVQLDCMYFIPEGQEIPTGRASFWAVVKFSVAKFIGSFFNDYQVQEGGKNTVKVWVSTGRDQLQIVSSMVKEFTNETKIPIQLNLVNTGDTLIQATLAGKGPDVALMIASDSVINLSMRGALVNLAQEKYNVEKEKEGVFSEAAWKRFRYNGGVYGIPETQVWPVLFYRTDIFEEMDLTPPNTWDEFYEMLRTLQGRNMNMGMTETSTNDPGVSGSIEVFQTLLFQRGGTYYNDDLTATLFDTPQAYEAFEQWTEIYSKFGVARSVDFYNRFRTGDVPIGFSGYTAYNQLAAAAPELRGLWKMALVPGTPRADGNIDRSVPSGGTGCMMLTAAEKHGVADEAYTFLKWWTETESQIRYGSELESIMGVAARYSPASIEAFHNMGWTDEEMAVLEEQRQWTQNVYSIPGDYMLNRSLTNAFRASLDSGVEPRRTLANYNRDINAEIKRKRAEFNLD